MKEVNFEFLMVIRLNAAKFGFKRVSFRIDSIDELFDFKQEKLEFIEGSLHDNLYVLASEYKILTIVTIAPWRKEDWSPLSI